MTTHNPEADYTLLLTDSGLACEHPRQPREAIGWEEVIEIAIVTTDEGPFAPDVWVLFIGESGGCSIPQGANGFDMLFDVFKKFPGFNYKAFIKAMSSTENAKFVCWRKQ